MKRWPIAVAAGLAVVALGVVGGTLRGAQPAPDPNIVILPATIVVANPAPANAPAPQRRVRPAAPTLPAATGTVLYSTDFTNGYNSADWHSPAFRNNDIPPLWTVNSQGMLYVAGDQTRTDVLEESVYLTGERSWGDMVLEASVLATDQQGAGLVWHVQEGDRSFYRVQLYADMPGIPYTAVLERVDNGRATELARALPTTYPGYGPDAWQSIKVQSAGDHQQVWVNGIALFDVRDGTYRAGQAGLFAWADSGTHFDNLRVQAAASAR